MNAPEPFESFVLPDGLRKVQLAPDTLTPNTVLLTLNREDHTLGNLICSALQRDPNVVFAGYKLPHPLEHHVLIRVQTERRHSPVEVVQRCIERLIKDLMGLEEQLKSELKRFPAHGPLNKLF
jgi:DNA-directed RNA polymerase II subunit RPB11